MRKKWALFTSMMALVFILAGCEPLLVLDPKGPQAERQANDILLSIGIMSVIVIVVMVILAYILIKYRASKLPDDYEPPHIHGNKWVEIVCVGVPILIVAYLSFVSVKSNYIVESTPEGYENQEPLVVYASSSDWKWHFSYPEEGIETVNYLYIPTNRPLEFKLYSYGPITSFWIPQLGGQKYAMSDMVTTLHLAADEAGEYMGRNANFSGKGFAENTFNVTAMSQADFDEWVDEVHQTAEPITESQFEKLLEPGHLGQMTFTGTHLEFSPAPEHAHNEVSEDAEENQEHSNHENHTEVETDHSGH
ncbi:cytochrome aa3 quinol oxidase subunit II [Ureibacillus sinduriensis]|uniref:Quinol oxidase subunit 2 n=1 Tax=Ureibacillus sinduriensis BLB-1 = JCM 15800 TaxID=1384057 RepID=A0A0A3HQE0_9BACL|nr:cytochrome aa3 quinol oxidase subunit II [Ureibacillus sinduriensis]KGR74766.1 quinol oxidase subunit 2 [Ureibacillus sinduriensis BLB-1 = JCM 15800]